MVDFDLDDPLGDLLSDGSNDSFFGTSAKKSTAKQEGTPSGSKSKIANLFGIEGVKAKEEPPVEETKPRVAAVEAPVKVSVPAPPGGEGNQTKRPAAAKSTKKDIQFDDSDDLIAELGFDPKKTKSASVKKTNILDDLLDFSRAAAPKDVRPKADPPPVTPPAPAASTMSSAAPNRYSPSLGRPRSTQRTNSGTSQNDPLGFFSTPAKPDTPKTDEKESLTRTKSAKKPATVDWLGLSIEKEREPEAVVVNSFRTEVAREEPEIARTETVPPIPQPVAQVSAGATATGLTGGLQLFNLASAEQESAVQMLQQQETQLLVANQMRQQEVALIDMHSKQKALLKKQEAQFNDLMRRQIDRQSALEDSIQQQQQRISSYVNVLMSQPPLAPASAKPRDAETEDDSVSAADYDDDVKKNPRKKTLRIAAIELEAEVKRLELEKLRLEDTLQSIRSSHEQELELLDGSHKKQIHLLEENLEMLEQRLRAENKFVEEHYGQKLAALEADKSELVRRYEERVASLLSEHESQLAKVRDGHRSDVDQLKSDQQAAIDNIRQAKAMEVAMAQEGSSYLATLKSASNYLESAGESLQTMRQEIDVNIDRLHKDRELQLDAREKRVEDQQKIMARTMEKTEEERARLIELIKDLEIKLNAIEKRSDEEQWTVRQQRASLEAERASFERERNFAREKLAAEEKRVEVRAIEAGKRSAFEVLLNFRRTKSASRTSTSA